MFGALKKLFSKQAEPARPAAPPTPPSPARPAAPAPAAPARPGGTPLSPVQPKGPVAAAPSPSAVPPSSVISPPLDKSGGTIPLALSTILAGLPPNLAALIGPNKEGTFELPIKVANAQLSTGAVRITFGQLRTGSPPNTFLDNPGLDHTMVALPLAPILAAINPANLARRAAQKSIAIPESVTSIFGKHKSFSASATVNAVVEVPDQLGLAAEAERAEAEEPKPIEPVAAPAPPPAPIPPPQPKPAPPPPPPVAPAPAPAPVASLPGASPFTVRPAAPTLPTAPKPPPGPSIIRPPTPAATPPPTPKLPAFNKPATAQPLPSAFTKPPTPAPLPISPLTPAAPTSSPTAHAPAADAGEAVAVAIYAIATAWPPPIQEEIAQLGLTESTVALPVSALEAGMRTGRVVFAWKQIAQMLKPAAVEVSAATGDTALDLPLAVIAPLFMARRRPVTPQKKAAVGENIPDLFGGAASVPKPAAAAPAEAPTFTPAAAPAPPPPPDPLGEIFGNPGKSYWTPPEIVEKIGGLKGVAGSAITMGDGLLVSGQLPAPLNAETIAAFVPQIFGRVTQSANEMQLSGINSLVLATGSGQCAIYKTGKLFLAVLGRPGEPLPEALLERIAAEVAKRNS